MSQKYESIFTKAHLPLLTAGMLLMASTTATAAAAAGVECNEQVAVYSTVDELANLFRDLTGFSPELTALAEGAIIPSLQTGLEVRKICGSCADYPHPSLCPETVYGFDTTHSGLLISPVQVNNDREDNDETMRLVPGTQMLNLHFHGALRHANAAPSSLAFPPNLFTDAGFDVFMGLAFSGSTATYTLLPDYQGFGESAADLFPSTLVQQGYVTGTFPVMRAAQAWVSEASDCASAIGNEVLLTGYSEGGYAAVAVMDAFSTLPPSNEDEPSNDITVVQTVAGAGAFRTGLQLMEGFKGFSTPGIIDPDLRFITTWTSVPFSSTTTDVVNFGAGQDLIDPLERERVLEAVRLADDSQDLNQLTEPNDPFAFYDPRFVDILQEALETGITDPCRELVVKGESDLLCQAILDQELITALETAQVPVTLFHSPDDELISFGNLPDLSANPNFVSFVPLQGSHTEAGGAFLVGILQSLFLNPETRVVNFVNPEDTTIEGGCHQSTPDKVEEEEEEDEEAFNGKYKATVICEGGSILSESSDSPLLACHTSSCGVPRNGQKSLAGIKNLPKFEGALLIPFWCTDDGVAGVCVKDAESGSFSFTDACPAGEEAIVTLTISSTAGQRGLLLRGNRDKKDMAEDNGQHVLPNGRTVTVYGV